MIQLTSSIAIHNLTRIKVRDVSFPDTAIPEARVLLTVESGGGNIYRAYTAVLRDSIPPVGEDPPNLATWSQGVRAVASPSHQNGYTEMFTLETPTGFSSVWDAYHNASGNRATRYRAVESALISIGACIAGSVS